MVQYVKQVKKLIYAQKQKRQVHWLSLDLLVVYTGVRIKLFADDTDI
jgi:hypothetical protein